MQNFTEYLWKTVTIEFMIKFCIVYFFVVWIGLILWVAKDIGSRSESRLFQAFCVLLMILLTPIWVFLYLLIRPRKSLYEKYYGEIEENLWILHEIVEERLWEDIDQVKELTCPRCEEIIHDDFTLCPHCELELKHPCQHCKKEIRNSWTTCPYCQKKQKKKKSTKKHKKKSD